MEKANFGGDNPSARFGHTITPIGKDKAILFGGAVGDTGNSHLIQVNMSSRVTPTSATITCLSGKNSITMACLPPTEQLTVPFLLITFFTFLEELSGVANLQMATLINWIS